MPEAVILFADNDPDFLETRSEFLKQEGYIIIPVDGPAEAMRNLKTKHVDLAIIDIRLIDDDDENDKSGLNLAKEAAHSVPIIIITGFPTVDSVRKMLRPQANGLPTAVEFIEKEQGPEIMIRAVEDAFTRHVRLNRKLEINWKNHKNRLSLDLIDLLEPALDSISLSDRTDELEALFRKLFFKYCKITIGPLQWHRPERISMRISVLSSDGISEQRKVVLGMKLGSEQEIDFLKKLVPDKTCFAETVHYFAIAYTLRTEVGIGQ